MKRITGLVALLCCFAISLSAQQPEYVELHYKFEKGNEFTLNMESRSETYITVQDVVQRTTRDYINGMTVTIAETGPGRTVLTWMYTDLKFNFNSKNRNIFVDAKTANPEEPLQGALQLLLNQPFTVELRSTGFIDKIEGLDALMEKASAAFSSLKSDEKEAYKKILVDQFGTEAFRSWLEQLLIVYPSYGIKINKQWEETVPLRTGLKGRIDLYWNLLYWDSNSAKINGTGKVKTDKVETFTVEDGIQATAQIEGNQTTNYVIDRESGFPSIAVQNTEMSGKYVYLANRKKQLKKDLTVPVRMITNASYKIKKLK